MYIFISLGIIKISKDKMHIKAFIGQGNIKRLAYEQILFLMTI